MIDDKRRKQIMKSIKNEKDTRFRQSAFDDIQRYPTGDSTRLRTSGLMGMRRCSPSNCRSLK
ncbi:MAG: hypothetical protein ACOX15_04415 [Tepidanaerobacteraceae bacterium]|jgi:hypothetical protein